MNVRGIPAALLLGAMPAVAQGQPAPTPPVAASSQEAALRVAQAAEALIATLPAEQQAAAREHARTGLAQADTQIADAIRQQRAEATAPAQ
jgi:hypothetical protein